MAEPASRGRGVRRLILWLVALSVMAFLLFHYWPRPAGKSGMPGFMGGGMATPVSVVQARTGQIDRSLRALGTVTPVSTVVIRPRVDGPLQSVHFQDGQRVRKGALLAVIDPAPFEIQLQKVRGQLKQHEAQLENARRDLARYETLHRQQSVARQQLDAARAQVHELEGLVESDAAAIADAERELGYTQIRAPEDGRLGLRRVDAGNLVHASDADGLVVLTRTQPVDVVFSISQGNLPALLAARRELAELDVELLGGVDGPVLARGTLSAVDNQIDVATGTVSLKARFENDADTLFPNQFVRVRLALGRQTGVVVPLRAVQRSSSGEFVYRVTDDDKASVTPVTTDVDDGTQVVIVSGLSDGDRVVVEGTDRLRDGSAIQVIAEDESAAPTSLPGREPARSAGS